MSVICVGLNHRTAPVELLERVAVPASRLTKALHDLAGREHLAEVVLLSTCNRTEVYARCTRFHPAVSDVREFLAVQSGADPDDFAEHLYTYYDDGAVAHLFGVAAGVDSMIVGEGEILGQVREAWRNAADDDVAGPLLSRAFRHAVEVGKRARTETEIGRRAASVSSATVALAAERLGSIRDRRVLVVGAGEVGEGMTRALVAAGAGEVVVANRTHHRATELASRVGGRVLALHEIAEALLDADVLLTSTGAGEVLVERADIEMVMARRAGSPLLVVDVAVPRNVDPGVGAVEGVTLLDIDDLKQFAELSMHERRREIGRVQRIIADELERFQADRTAREVAPLVTALRARAEEIRVGELERFVARLANVDPSSRESIDALTRSILNKLLHEPTIRLKDAAGTARGELLSDALAALFDLPAPGGSAGDAPFRGVPPTDTR